MIVGVRAVKTQEFLSYFCYLGQHFRCPGKAQGTRSDPVIYVCTCSCHKGKGANGEKKA